MRDYGRLSPLTFWVRGPGRVLRGDHLALLLASYLHTGPHSTMTGLVHIAPATIAHDLGCEIPQVLAALHRLSVADIAHFDDELEMLWLVEGAGEQMEARLSFHDKRRVGLVRELERLGPLPMVRSFWERYAQRYNLGKLPEWLENVSPFQAPSKGAQEPEPAPVSVSGPVLTGAREGVPKSNGKVSPFDAPSKPRSGSGTEPGSRSGSGSDPTPPPGATESDDGLVALDAAIAEMGQAKAPAPAPLPPPPFDLTPPPGPKPKARPRVTGEQQPAPARKGLGVREKLYVASWEQGVAEATGRTVAYRVEYPIAQDLIAIARAHLPGKTGDDVLDGLRDIATEYAKIFDGSQYHPGLLPKHALRWLNDGKRMPTASAKPQGGALQPGNHLDHSHAEGPGIQRLRQERP